jgi:hypothetical protein
MVNTIEFYSTASTPEIDPPETETTDPEEIESTEDVESSETTESTEEIESTETDTDEIESTVNGETDTEESGENKPGENKPGENKPGENKPSDNNKPSPENGGCGSSIAGGAVIITVISFTAFAIARKKKED